MGGPDVERTDLVRSHMERIRVVGWLVGRGRRSISTVLGSLGEHALGGLDAPPLVWPSTLARGGRVAPHGGPDRRERPVVARGARREAAVRRRTVPPVVGSRRLLRSRGSVRD